MDVESGLIPATGKRYELYTPNSTSIQLPGVVILLHGFQSKLDAHRGTAALLAQNGIACLILDLLPLMGFRTSTLHRLRSANVAAVVSVVHWVANQEKLNKNKIMLAGHSAGGAIAFEAACVCGSPLVKGVLLLDAVPWQSTLTQAKNASSWLHYSQSLEELVEFARMENPLSCMVVSIRGEESDWNAKGMILELLARNGTNQLAGDFKCVGAKHGDFMASCVEDCSEALAPGCLRSVVYGLGGLNVVSMSREVRVRIQDLVLHVCGTVLGQENGQLVDLGKRLEHQGLLVVQLVPNTLPSRIKNMPSYLL